MANYVATARSNYFRVKDPQMFIEWCLRHHLDQWTKEYEAVGTRYAISPQHWGEEGWPHTHCDELTGDLSDIDFTAELATHLDPRDVAVLIEVGSEKLRYLIGEALAVRADGSVVRVTLDDIYERAFEELDNGDVTVTEATY